MFYILIWGHLSVRGFKWSKCLVQLPRHITNHIFSIDNLSENHVFFIQMMHFRIRSAVFFQNSSSTLQWQSPLAKSLHLSDQCLMIGGLLEVISCVRAILAEPHRRCLLLSWNFLCRFCSNSLDTCSETLYKGFCMNFHTSTCTETSSFASVGFRCFRCLPLFAYICLVAQERNEKLRAICVGSSIGHG